MLNHIINPVVDNLNRAKLLINHLDNNDFKNTSVGPYNASIGGHLRHVLDLFDCLFEGVDQLKVDFTARKRNELVESNKALALEYLETTIQTLKNMSHLDPNTMVEVMDDLGSGEKISVNYTLGSAICQAHSHTIHHFACIGYVLEQLGQSIPDSGFGYNPTTPKHA